jgi:hypothetical protein
LLFDFQLDAARQQQLQLIESARQFETLRSKQANRAMPAALIGGAIPRN